MSSTQIAGRYGVIGNPIEHSLSPIIQRQFAGQFGFSIDYQKYLVEPAQLKFMIKDFFSRAGQGLNVTLPFKQAVIELVEELSEEARLANSVNTLWLNQHGQLAGDTTDGEGLLLDLTRLGFDVANKCLVVAGAGGASQSIVAALLKHGASIRLVNRTAEKIPELSRRFADLGDINIYQPGEPFDGLINATSRFNLDLIQPLSQVIGRSTFCYDLNYGERAADFKRFAKSCGANQVYGGSGMLIGQAAKSFQRWTGKLPDISKVSLDYPLR